MFIEILISPYSRSWDGVPVYKVARKMGFISKELRIAKEEGYITLLRKTVFYGIRKVVDSMPIGYLRAIVASKMGLYMRVLRGICNYNIRKESGS